MTDLFDHKEPEPRSRSDFNIDAEFAQFWSIYPRHVAKKAAFEKFKIARRHHPFETILHGAERYAAHVRGLDQQYILHGSTWLHGERWDDVLTPRSNGPTRGTDALRNRLRTEIENGEVSGYGGEGDPDLHVDGRFPRLTH